MRKLKVVAVLAVLLLVTACTPSSGKITNRRFTPTHEKTEKVGDRVTKKIVPDKWELYLVKDKNEGWLTVNKTTYELCTTGEMYPDCAKG